LTKCTHLGEATVTERQSPLQFALYWKAIKGSMTLVSENNLALVSAGVAFFSMLSLFPALAALIALLGLIADPVFVVTQLEELRGLLPNDVYEIINAQVVGLVNTQSDTLGRAGLISLLVALWSARAGVAAMIVGLNSVYGAKNRHLVKHYLLALLLTLMLVVVVIIAVVSLIVTPVALSFFPLGGIGLFLIDALRWIVAVSVLMAGVGVLYRFGPNHHGPKVRWLSPGALLAVVAWIALSVAFSYYVANFGNYNQVYGSIGAVIAMLIWLWISSFLALIGAALNAQLEIQHANASLDPVL
jgi:membrane protein